MGWYQNSLDSLIRGLDARAIPGAEGLDALYGLQQERRERRQAKREAAVAAEQEMRGGLQDLAFSEAQQGTPMSSLLDLARAQTGAPFAPVPGMTPSAQLKSAVPGLDALYEGGVSTVKPTLDDEDQQAILEDLAQGVPPAQIYAGIEQAYPDQYAALLPQLDTLIKAARSRSALGG